MSDFVSKYLLVYHPYVYSDDNTIKTSIPHDELKPTREEDQPLIPIALKHFNKTADLKAVLKVRTMIGVINVSDEFGSDGGSMDTSLLSSKHKLRQGNV